MSLDQSKMSAGHKVGSDIQKRRQILADLQRILRIGGDRRVTCRSGKCPPLSQRMADRNKILFPDDRNPLSNHTNPDSQSEHSSDVDGSGQTSEASS